MNAVTTGRASQALSEQVEIFGKDTVSLSSLWRVVGCPNGHDPGSWIRLADTLVDGYGTYRAKVGPIDREAPRPRVVWTWDGDTKDPWRQGDLMTERLVAIAYALYLDEKVEGESHRLRVLD